MLLINPFRTIKSIYSRPLDTNTTSVHNGEKKQRVCVRKTIRVLLYKEMVSVCYTNNWRCVCCADKMESLGLIPGITHMRTNLFPPPPLVAQKRFSGLRRLMRFRDHTQIHNTP